MPIRMIGKAEAVTLVTDALEATFNRFLLAFFQAVVSGTPVDTGFPWGCWLIEFGRFVARVVGSRANPGPVPSATQAGVWRATAGNIFVHNSGVAIDLLEDGLSAQAPQGMLGPALAATRGLLEAG
jgi:hypothetical protein